MIEKIKIEADNKNRTCNGRQEAGRVPVFNSHLGRACGWSLLTQRHSSADKPRPGRQKKRGTHVDI